MRIKNSIRNMIYIYGSTLLIAILNLVVRRIFLDVLIVDYLGYDGLFTSIFSFLSLSEMGIASIITFHMYSELASNNLTQIRKLLYIYKLIYRIVGIFVFAVGIIASLFIPLILNEQQQESWLFIYTIYFLQLAATLCTYFLAYRRILFTTDQKIYVCTAVDTAVNIVAILAKMCVLLWLRNYIIYLLVAIAANITSNLVIARKSYKAYPEITRIKVTKEDIRELNLFHEVKNMMATKIAGTIYGSSDDIIITAVLGISMNGLISNYRMISSKIQELIIAMFNSVQASIGNLVYTEDDHEKGVAFFHALDLTGFLMGLVCAVGVISIGQPFVLLWLKSSNYLLPYSFLILLAFNMFIAICNNPMNYFRNSLGHFETDRNYMIAAAAVNVIVTIALSIPLGITGVMIGTVAGHLMIFMGRTVVVYKFFLEEKPYSYYLRFLGRVIVLAACAGVSVFVGNIVGGIIGDVPPAIGGFLVQKAETAAETIPFAIRLAGLLIRGVISVVVSVIFFWISSFKTGAYATLWKYVKTVIGLAKRKK